MPLVGQIITARKPIKIFPRLGHPQYVEIVPIGSVAGEISALSNYNGSTWVRLQLDKNGPFPAFAKLDYEAMGIEKLFNEGKITQLENEALKSSGSGLGLLLGAGFDLSFIGWIFKYGLIVLLGYVGYKVYKK